MISYAFYYFLINSSQRYILANLIFFLYLDKENFTAHKTNYIKLFLKITLLVRP